VLRLRYRPSLHLDELLDALLGRTHCAREGGLGEIVTVQRRGEVIARSGHRFLRLYDLDGVGYTCTEAIARLRQGASGQFHIALSNNDLFGGRSDIEESGAHLVFDLRPEVGEFVGALLPRGFGFFDVAADSAAIEDVEIQRTGHEEHAVRISNRG